MTLCLVKTQKCHGCAGNVDTCMKEINHRKIVQHAIILKVIMKLNVKHSEEKDGEFYDSRTTGLQMQCLWKHR